MPVHVVHSTSVDCDLNKGLNYHADKVAAHLPMLPRGIVSVCIISQTASN